MNFNQFFAFLYRDYCIEKSYKIHLITKFTTVVFQLLVFYFLCKHIDINYFNFLFSGILFSRTIHYTLVSLNETIRQEQYWGTIERLILFPQDELITFLYSTATKFVFLIIEILLLVMISHFLGLYYSLLQIIFIFVFTIFSIILLLWIGILISSLTLLFPRGDNLVWLITILIDLLSGIYFPPELLPEPFCFIGKHLPTTSMLTFFRGVLYNQSVLFNKLGYTIIFTFIFTPIAIYCFNYSLRNSLFRGNLVSY